MRIDHAAINDLPGLSIRRPVLVMVANLLIVLAGVAAFLSVEVRELPDVDFPVVSVFVVYPGASPETIDAEVTSILEGAVARVSGVKNINSSSEEDFSRIRIEFQPGIDLDTAASDVREAVNRVQRRLPDRVEEINIIKADSDSQPIMNLSVSSDSLIEEDISRIIEKDIIPELISIDGIADISLFGERKRVLRVVVDPLRLTSLGLSVADVIDTLQRAPFDVPAGSFRSENQELVVRADASVYSAEQVANLIIRDNTRVGDVAKIYFGPEDARRYTRINGRSVIAMGVIRKAKSNTIEISNNVHATIERINARFDNLEIFITNDDAGFIRSSVREVLIALTITILVVIATIRLFMGSMRATLIPSIAIPISLIGTVAGIWMFGFSINTLTLFALVLATGLVVDDAIVVLENILRRRKKHVGGRAAALLGTRQVFFAVVTTTAVLVSVFLPIAFLPGTAGRLFREFGFVMAVAVVISSFVSLTLVPAMASRLPETDQEKHTSGLIGRFGTWLIRLYSRSLGVALDHPFIAVATAIGLGVAAFSVYQTLDQELVPTEDRGMFRVNMNAPDGVGIGYMDQQVRKVEQKLSPLVDNGEIQSLFTIVGTGDPNRASIVVPLVDWKYRDRSQQEIMREVNSSLADIPGLQISVSGSNSLSVGRGGEGNRLRVALLGNEYAQIYESAKAFAGTVAQQSQNLSGAEISYEQSQPQLLLEVDRRRVTDLGINLDNLAETLRVMIDGDEIVDLNIQDESIPILLEASTEEINDPTDLVNLYVDTESGGLLPLSSVVTLREEGIASELPRQAQRRAIEVEFDITPGYPLQDAVEELQEVAAEVLPGDVSMILLGDAATLAETSREVMITYIIALLVVFLVLCAQFEGFTSAIVVMLLVPFGIAAAIFALFITGTSLNIYSQIGLVMLIGLMAKNGVLVVEFADQLRDRGQDIRKAIETGAVIRLRPVTMTMLCTVLGGLPLILSSGAGAEARASIGWVVFGGLGMAALFTLYLTPVLYILLARFTSARAAETRRLTEELHHAEAMRGKS